VRRQVPFAVWADLDVVYFAKFYRTAGGAPIGHSLGELVISANDQGSAQRSRPVVWPLAAQGAAGLFELFS